MTCGHCVRSVTEEVGAIPGVSDVSVDLATGAADRHDRVPSPSPTTPYARPSPRPATRSHERHASTRSASSPPACASCSAPRSRSATPSARSTASRRRWSTATDDAMADMARHVRGRPTRVPGGLQVAQDGYRLVLDEPRQQPAERRHRVVPILGPDGEPLTDYDDAARQGAAPHRRQARPDGLPARAPDARRARHVDRRSSRSTPGQWRVFADFDPAGKDPELDPRRRPVGRRRLRARSRSPEPSRTAHGRRLHRHARRRRSWPARDAEADPDGRQGRQAGHRPAALPRARTATWSRCATATSPTCTSTPTASRATARPSPGRTITFHADVPVRGQLPAVPRLPARRRRPHRRVHRRGRGADGGASTRGDSRRRRARALTWHSPTRTARPTGST